ncbi:methyltransferase domain-containing protein [Sphingomonas sp.]|uniref:methyltransferase domain-containing protein n=1 Tax=Sphingomonas sp. TaxID=28214 RepID=UPI003AFF684C
MPDGALLAACRGDAVSVGARTRWSLVADAPAMRYCDEFNRADFRSRNPAWRATPLASVSLVCDVWTLDGLADASLDCLVAFRLFAQAERAAAGLRAARRVLRPGGTLLLPAPDARYRSGVAGDEEAALYAGMDAVKAALLPGQDAAGKDGPCHARCACSPRSRRSG